MHTRLSPALVLGLAGLFLAPLGCRPDHAAPDSPQPPRPLAGTELHLLVVDDPPLAAAIERLRGEWSIRTAGEFRVRRMAADEFQAAPRVAGDAVICPAADLGPAVQRKLVLPLDAAQPRLARAAMADAFELVRREQSWGDRSFGVPFGSPTLVCCCRADLLDRLGRRPPQTWPEYLELARLLAERPGPAASTQKTAWHATAEPLGPGWAGLTLLARAASYAKHRQNYSALFHIDSMEPLVAGPPFCRALEELVAAARLGAPEQLRWTPANVRQAFWQGRCGLALTWPTAADTQPEAAKVAFRAVFAELPGSPQVFDIGRARWDTRSEEEEYRVPLLGMAGRVGLVAASSARPDAALELLVWLSSAQPDAPASAASLATTLFRVAHLKHPSAWVEKPARTIAAQYAATARRTLSRADGLCAPRIPGRLEYLTALDKAVHRAVTGQSTPAEALQAAVEQWRAVTARLGLKSQRTAYRRSLGLEP